MSESGARRPQLEQIERLLQSFQPRPSERFHRRMAHAPWARRRLALPALFPTRRWALALATLALALLLAASTAAPLASSRILPQPLANVWRSTAHYVAINPQAPYALNPLAARQLRSLDSTGLSYVPPCCSTGGTTTVNGEPYDATFFENYGTNPFIDTEDDTLSTFGLDVDTASYTIMRRYLGDGYLPDKDAVRVEEVVNYFDQHYPQPAGGAFSINLEGAPSRFGGEHYWLVKIGLQGRTIEVKERKDAVLTFVIDVSGSMAAENRLGAVKYALGRLVAQLRSSDQVAIVVYGTDARVVLPATPATRAEEIMAAINALQPEGSTNAEAGLRVGYALAAQAYREGAINRVILCTDGVANNGITSADGILQITGEYAARGINLTTVGFGMGNYNDVLLEQLADKGDGSYAYVDTPAEAERIFVENLTGTLQVIAREARVQVEFNPQVVSRYRLLGYENRDIADQQFRDDTVDAGEVGSGQSVTALYELKLNEGASGEALIVRLRYQDPDSGQVVELSQPLQTDQFRFSFDAASPEFRLTAAAAEFAEILRHSYWARDSRLSDVLPVLYRVREEQPADVKVAELVQLVERAAALMGEGR
jgi:Ca-activated chloride channel family protein